MEAFILGTGGMMPLPGRYLTSVLLRREGSLFLFDCGEGTQVSLRRLNLKWKKIDAIFISHTHADHVTGLPGILMLSSQVDRNEPLYIIGPPKIKHYIESNRASLDMYINYQIIVIEIDPSNPQEVFKGEGFTIQSFPLKHTKPCVGYTLIEDERPGIFYPDKALALNIPAGPLWGTLQRGEPVEFNGRIINPSEVMGPPRSGRKFSFVTDTLYHEGIAKYVKNSNLLICEGMFGEGMEEQAEEKRHMTAYQAGLVAKEAAALSTGLIHYSPRYHDKELGLLLDEARKNSKNTFLCRDRMAITIPNTD
ncbi:MAG: ribonuclease Z [Spirochaetaceae bacterium]|nr:ribonuclease Z [Spirochaetaceae bacterium]